MLNYTVYTTTYKIESKYHPGYTERNEKIIGLINKYADVDFIMVSRDGQIATDWYVTLDASNNELNNLHKVIEIIEIYENIK